LDDDFPGRIPWGQRPVRRPFRELRSDQRFQSEYTFSKQISAFAEHPPLSFGFDSRANKRGSTSRSSMMRNALRTSGVAVLAAATIVVGSLAASSPAEARRGWVGPAIVGGIALGALAAASAPRYGYAYGPGYGYHGAGYYGGGYYGCPRRVVGYTYYGRPIVRRVCY
jgi:hypothetical protein